MARVLIVDDDHSIVRMLRLMLRTSGFEVSIAYDGREALDEIERDPPDVVLLDLNMPVMDGETFLRVIRNRGMQIPVIVTSARAWFDPQWPGPDAFIAKPFHPQAVVDAIDRLTSGSAAAI